ncbi:PAS domain S-box-containing protein/diguanylate cyclase (GGDEF) domain-containing protein [Paenibacillus tianmuensis]|uniref:PAS domain S-box-containing protein/diguanylate cyclase (GGDEF) domain-containing protein n=1 Tax=Paenibacillus tianmuensis TaxID=624147 RepID=A0A1G4RVH7_9BACL|nr:diguanylate cyclase [Paenibacillus tianmuensis]SCW60475.1 PAS domain S-box-containing protein/diguanylate cyclase (GGDEF) domain-containing protein [Paenibacillus tianmuensis]
MFQLFIANLALLTAFMFLSSRLLRNHERKPFLPAKFRFVIGGAHGFFGILLMFFSVRIDGTTILDFRQIAIIAAAHFGGIYASAVAGLIIATGRIAMFGVTPSSLTAATTAVLLGLISGILAKRITDYWKKWLFSIAASIGVITFSLFFLLGWQSWKVNLYFVAVILSGGLFVAYLIRYLTDANRLVYQLEESEAKYRRSFTLQEAIFRSATGVAIIFTDPAGVAKVFNPGAERMFGIPADEAIGRRVPGTIVEPKEFALRKQELQRQSGRPVDDLEVFVVGLSEGKGHEQEWTFVRRNGERFHVHLMLSEVRERGDGLLGYLAIIVDRTESKQAEETMMQANRMLEQLSRRDGLTGVANRRAFDEFLDAAWAKAAMYSQSLSVIMLDIDCFKAYNDTYGHQGGDACLKQVAGALQRVVGNMDGLAARYGGEEFVVILTACRRLQAAAVAESIRREVEALRIRHIGSSVSEYVTVSVGTASSIPYAGLSPLELVGMADKALYRAKQEGRNRSESYQPGN